MVHLLSLGRKIVLPSLGIYRQWLCHQPQLRVKNLNKYQALSHSKDKLYKKNTHELFHL